MDLDRTLMLNGTQEESGKARPPLFEGLDHLGIHRDRTAFAGDGGNDMPALASGLQAVFVAHASEEIRQIASEKVEAQGLGNRLYLAKGDFMGMNGNSAGVLEGLVYYIPHVRH